MDRNELNTALKHKKILTDDKLLVLEKEALQSKSVLCRGKIFCLAKKS